MKLLSLGLERYGRFTDRELTFDSQARVTVICGANEAGKTTALSAVADVLYGIEERSRYDFLHAKPNMRLSATLVGADGRKLAFARVKRRTATLVDPAGDAPLPDDCLAPFLGGHDRTAFLEIFALDQARLRAGGKALLAGGGDLANALLAAAPGLGDVVALRDRLKDSTAQIFNPDRRVASHVFYKALDRRKEARDRIRERELRVEEVKKARDGAEQATERRSAAIQAEIEAGLALAQAKSLALAAKELRDLDAAQAERRALGDLPDVPPNFVAQAREKLAAEERERLAFERAVALDAEASGDCAAIIVDEPILAVAGLVESCDEQRAAVSNELASLSRRKTEASEARAGLAHVAAGLGLADVDTFRDKLPSPPGLARAEALTNRQHALGVRAEALAAERAKLAARRRDLEAARAGLGAVADPASLKRQLAALDGAEERERALRAAGGRLDLTRRELDERVRRLGLGVAGAEALATLPLPAPGAAEATLRDIAAASDTLARKNQAHAELEQERARLGARLDMLNAGRPAPTEAAIALARGARDALWSSLRGLARRERAAEEGDAQQALQLDGAIAAADRLADERQSETQRLADLARTEQDIADPGIRIEASRREIAQMDLPRDGAGDAWRALWSASGLALPPGEQALAVLREIESVRQARSGLRRDEADQDAHRETVRADRGRCDALLEALSLPPLGQAPLRLADARAAIAALEKEFLAARDLDAPGKAETDLAYREARHGDDEAALRREQADLFPAVAIRSDAPTEEAREVIRLWREGAGLLDKLATAERRVDGIERDRDAFVARAADLSRQAGGEIPPDAFQAARQLRARLDAARLARSQAETAGKILETRRRALAKAQSALELARGDLAVVLTVAQVQEAAGLPPLLEQLERTAACDRRIGDCRRRLDEFRGARSEEGIRGAAAERSDEDFARIIAEASAGHESARAARDRAVEEDTRACAALDALEGREGAAQAAQDEQDALAEIAAAIERFTRDHVAARLLTLAIDRYREQRQNPIVERASRAFAALTGGRWSGVGIDYDADPPQLEAVRDARMVRLAALSEGTADQLFLALRVAAIEEHARRAAPLPFLADDLFVSFDEARTEAGLSLLAELGATTQVIVFTHHPHVAACAGRALAGAASIIEL